MPFSNESLEINQGEILQRFQAILEADLSEQEIETRLKTTFTEEEQQILTDTILGAIVASEGERHLNEQF
jgi:hypothetical protein